MTFFICSLPYSLCLVPCLTVTLVTVSVSSFLYKVVKQFVGHSKVRDQSFYSQEQSFQTSFCLGHKPKHFNPSIPEIGSCYLAQTGPEF